jgi:hypothetical protein
MCDDHGHGTCTWHGTRHMVHMPHVYVCVVCVCSLHVFYISLSLAYIFVVPRRFFPFFLTIL